MTLAQGRGKEESQARKEIRMNGVFQLLSPAGEALCQGTALAGGEGTGISSCRQGKGASLASLASFESLFRLFMREGESGESGKGTLAVPQAASRSVETSVSAESPFSFPGVSAAETPEPDGEVPAEGLQGAPAAAARQRGEKSPEGVDGADHDEVPEGQASLPYSGAEKEFPVRAVDAGPANGPAPVPLETAAEEPAVRPDASTSRGTDSASSKPLPPLFPDTVKEPAARPAPFSPVPADANGESPGTTLKEEETGQRHSTATAVSPEREAETKTLRTEELLPMTGKEPLREEGRTGRNASANAVAKTEVSGEAAVRDGALAPEERPMTARSTAAAGQSGPERSESIPAGIEGTDAGDAARTKENPSLAASVKPEGGKETTESASVREGGFTMEPKPLQETSADGLETEAARRSRTAVSSHEVAAVKADASPAGSAGKQGAAAQPVNAQELMDTVVGMRQTLGKNSGKVTLTLEPPSLGALTLEVQVRDRRVETVLVADSFEVQQVLKGGLEHLRSALQEQGLKVDTIQVLWQGAPSDGGTGESASHSFSQFFREQPGSQGGTGNWAPGGQEESSTGDTGTRAPLYEKGRGEGINVFA